MYEYMRIAKIKRHKSSLLIPEVLETVGHNRYDFVSFFQAGHITRNCSPRRSNSAIVYNCASSALFLLLRGENVTVVIKNDSKCTF